MLNRQTKALYFALTGPFMRLNGFLFRHFRAPRKPGVKVHLGPGRKHYLQGWINVDANMFSGICDVWADLRNPLPFPDATVEAMYSHHVIEHLPDLETHFLEAFRCLKPGGIYRVGGPNGDSAIRKFVDQDLEWFSDFPIKRASIGGRFENFIFCRQEHLTILTQSFLEELMLQAGFRNIRRCLPTKESRAPEIFGDCMKKEDETDFSFPHTLILEGEKPGSPR
ncbi:MAG: methyltransferase domain-containing protein [Holophagaceae bacterium]|nr:methyltransferase domain-containing protein [Holophagaceae bacterium]